MSAKEILAEAFAKVQAEHGIALERVRFRLADFSDAESDHYVLSRVSFEGIGTSKPPSTKTVNLEEIALEMRRAMVNLIDQNIQLQSEKEYANLSVTLDAARALEVLDKYMEGKQ